ncbi:MAG: glycosyltransferase family 2 protein [Pseudomonadota bacterium]
MADVCVIIVAYNSAGVLAEAVSSVPDGIPVIVVDNASTDDSAKIAAAAGARVIDAGGNLGFGAGCNLGAAAADTEFLMLLNPDARLEPSTLDLLMAEMRTDSGIAAAGPLLLNGEGKPEMPRALTLLDEGQAMMEAVPSDATDIGFLSGAALLIRRDVFEEIGGFDAEIFLYLEDDDLCLRLRQAGHRLRLVPEARVMHHEATSSPPSRRSLWLRNHHTMASHVYLASKHGIDVDFGRLRRKARQRLILAWMRLDLDRVAMNRGRISGLRAHGPGRLT